jgi:hypothetical protein
LNILSLVISKTWLLVSESRKVEEDADDFVFSFDLLATFFGCVATGAVTLSLVNHRMLREEGLLYSYPVYVTIITLLFSINPMAQECISY